MAHHQTGDKPLSEPMMAYVADAYMQLYLVTAWPIIALYQYSATAADP